ncbi:MAG: phosphopentomutase [Sporolactobacillus sp.]|jgi:phosphopentomutase|nr:phosphopentomutase [Sporolactobacillus sp.]
MTFKRINIIVIDSVGIGEAADADKYGDVGADTLGHIGEYWQGKFNVPNLQKLGLSTIRKGNPIQGVPVAQKPLAYYGKMHEISAGKDSMDGHWEMMGLPVTHPLHTFPNGFPNELIHKIESFSGRKVLCNKPMSGTEVIKQLGERQMKTGELIVYTSGDSVLQIAAHEDVIPVAELYQICKYVRKLTVDEPYHLGRIIARPYIGPDKDHFMRTSRRHDFTLEPPKDTDMDLLKKAGYDVIAIGKINDIFSGHGITRGFHTTSNADGMNHLSNVLDEDFNGLCFTNLVDFDAKFGHRRNPIGYGRALMAFDNQLSDILPKIKEDDLLIITADHGNDPCFKGTDHTREYVPLLVYSPRFGQGKSLGIRSTFSDIGKTVLDNFDVRGSERGTSFLNQLG